MFCKLKRAIYGLKQAGREWWRTIVGFLIEIGFQHGQNEPCFFTYQNKDTLTLLALYVDDIAICSDSQTDLIEIKQKLADKLKLKDLGKLEWVLEVKVERDDKSKKIRLTQEATIMKILKKFEMTDCIPKTTPSTLGHERNQEIQLSPDFPYREMVGSLMYLATVTRPDIAYSVNTCARYLSNPSKTDEIAVKRIIRYIKHTAKLGIEFGTVPVCELTAFVDSDWANSKEDRKSTTGYVIFYHGPISWVSRCQKYVALSSTEAEYIALTEVAKDVMHCLQVLADADIAVTTATVRVDNQSAMVLATSDSTSSRRSKHIDVRYHYIREKVRAGLLRLEFVPSQYNTADILTKPLGLTSLVTMMFSSFATLYQKRVKRFIAYSSINHVGYMLMGLSSGTLLGVHAFFLYAIIYLITMFSFFGILISLRKDTGKNIT